MSIGIVLYVVFFEIFPKAKEIGGTGFQHVIAMMVGFGAFLPSLLFRNQFGIYPPSVNHNPKPISSIFRCSRSRIIITTVKLLVFVEQQLDYYNNKLLILCIASI